MKPKKDFEEGVHYYLEGERVIFTALFHVQRGSCCGNGCRHCAYEPDHQKGSKVLKEEFKQLKLNSWSVQNKK